MELEQGDILEGNEERWEVMRFLGRGKCCSVYEACQDGSLINEKRAAVKVYKKDERYASAGMNEAHLLQMLHKDSDDQSMLGRRFIVSLLDVFTCEGHLCLLNASLSYSLHNIFSKNSFHGNGLPLYAAQKCCNNLACALEYLQKKEVIHADIKLSNIMWNSQSEVFQFVDFGLSFIAGKQPPQQIQSPGFQAPEVQEWNKNIGTPSKKVDMCGCTCDVWSMACVLYLLYTGHPLVQAEEKLPLVCHECLKAGVCRYNGIIKEHLSIQLMKQKGVTKEQQEAIIDLLSRMLRCKPVERIKPHLILTHPLLSVTLAVRYPSLTNLLILPTRILQLTNMFDDLDELHQSDEYQDFLDDIREECEVFGLVKTLRVPFLDDTTNINLIGKIYVEFVNASDCEVAQRQFTGRTFNKRTVVTSFFPMQQFKDVIFY